MTRDTWHVAQTNAFLAQCRNQEKAAAKDSLQRAHLEIKRLKDQRSAMRIEQLKAEKQRLEYERMMVEQFSHRLIGTMKEQFHDDESIDPSET